MFFWHYVGARIRCQFLHTCRSIACRNCHDSFPRNYVDSLYIMCVFEGMGINLCKKISPTQYYETLTTINKRFTVNATNPLNLGPFAKLQWNWVLRLTAPFPGCSCNQYSQQQYLLPGLATHRTADPWRSRLVPRQLQVFQRCFKRTTSNM